jgi:hypothetical protein
MSFARPIIAATVSGILMGCIARGEPEPGRLPEAEAGASELTDSLVLTAPDGTTIWLTEGRASTDSAGAACVERSIEIRRDTTRLKVPLLYTITAPVLLDDTTMRAELAERCRADRSYRIDLRTTDSN